MLASSGLGNDFGFAHAAGQQSLTQHIVDFVRAGMVQLIALEIEFCPAKMLRQPFSKIERRWSANKMFLIIGHLSSEAGIRLCRLPGRLYLKDKRHQCFRNKAPAMNAKPALFIRPGAIRIQSCLCHLVPCLLRLPVTTAVT